MSAVIAWTCKLCGHHAEGLDVAEYMTTEQHHVCKVADQIRRAVPYWRTRGHVAIADWLDNCARQADDMPSPDSYSVCDEPGSVQYALRVAITTPWTEAK